ncbi:MAG: hypothetical protein JSR36_07150 [Proteobacteria bacterium]|nr:hypothetical protein [Pseudomonadota bacterium]
MPTPNTIKLSRAGAIAAPVLASLLGACAGNGQGLDANGNPVGAGGGAPPTTLTADFKSIQENVFTPICVHCHSGASAPEGLQLDEAHSYALLVGVASAEQPSLQRVNPGDPDSSYLVQKLEGSAGITGARMPFGGPYLPQSTIAVIRQWITNGAQSPSASGTSASFAVTTLSPADGARVHAGSRPIVVAFSSEPDMSLMNESTLRLERVLPEGLQEVPGGVTLSLARGNPSTVLVTPRQGLAPGQYRLSIGAGGGLVPADVDARALQQAQSSEFTVEDRP